MPHKYNLSDEIIAEACGGQANAAVAANLRAGAIATAYVVEDTRRNRQMVIRCDQKAKTSAMISRPAA
jgi:hypothetical protein